MSKVVSLLVLLLDLAGLAIAIGGLGKMTDMCRKEEVSSSLFSGIFLTDERAYDCGVHFSLEWWIVSFHVFCIFAALLASFVDALNSKHIILHCFAISTTLFCWLGQHAIQGAYAFKDDTSSTYGKAVKALAAGCITVLTTNFLFAFTYGRQEPSDAAAPIESKA
eukprot:CAMPEP_0202950138 /NCGR_PEP_ID=MMETSP1395-20130829/19497_1 /ASSEMBLY_ACC=CAM_ASM_000871 /TAXON_ID=5961 /ORGANISM="Blepharisma japonicum, Strain Stock R1072" /LENGTH=164 /DNA_ID=CAMNT_0049653983 /DNA_START=15 /DNA_END=509 /DNA_ORIENTATION=+